MTTGEQLRDSGMQAAASKYRKDLEHAQYLAELWALSGRVCTSDDIRELFLAHEGRELKIGNGIASLFSRRKWVVVGRTKSKRKEAHARYINQYRLKGAK